MVKKIKDLHSNLSTTARLVVSIVAILAILNLIGYAILRLSLNSEISNLSNSDEEMSVKISELEKTLGVALENNQTLSDTLAEYQEQYGSFEKQIGKIDNAVDDLEKLSKTDPELLQKYSKVFFLNEHYEPSTLRDISDKYLYDRNRDMEIHGKVESFLEDLMDEAEDDGLELQIISAYRSFDTQSSLKNQYVVTYGAGTANQFSADQGYSEHQLGTTVDFTSKSLGASFERFDETEEYQWLLRNAHKFGFVLSYPENNAYYQFEPWHWRFVGRDLADDLHDDGKGFYETDQRKIDRYLIKLWD